MITDLFDFATHMRAGILAIVIMGLLFWLNHDKLALRVILLIMFQAFVFITAVFSLIFFL
jgi:hypothetical protein